jgi:hypothetical protein
MSEKQIQDLTRLYNTLLLISTKGEDTLIMAECLKALQTIVEEGAAEAGIELKRKPVENEVKE